jgi:hypothetical protein
MSRTIFFLLMVGAIGVIAPSSFPQAAGASNNKAYEDAIQRLTSPGPGGERGQDLAATALRRRKHRGR